ncbi:hypothetical protein BZG01_15220 [Labilibaculum manganireducens]|uniref:Uncharacterized protein n=1 Tax=Labilibaculum manganireducens TaxID=1940525 RepID=A0A2N3I164_9BACT|nr:hypothetical protein BZG01_15220 [Labilibaculum manganireducens]
MKKILKYLALILFCEIISLSIVAYINLYFRQWKYMNITHLLIFFVLVVVLFFSIKKYGAKFLYRILAILLFAGISFFGMESIDGYLMFDREISKTILHLCGWENISIWESESESRVYGLFTIILPGFIVFYTLLMLLFGRFLPKFLK